MYPINETFCRLKQQSDNSSPPTLPIGPFHYILHEFLSLSYSIIADNKSGFIIAKFIFAFQL